MKNAFKRCSCLVLALILTLMSTMQAGAISAEVRRFNGANNILFYERDGSDTRGRNFCNSGGDCNITGSTRDEKLWSGLRHVGFTPEQTAGIMGNLLNEGGSPTTQEYAYNNARNNGCKTLEGQEYTIHTDITTGAHHSGCVDGYASGAEVVGIGLGFAQWSSHDRREGYLAKMEELGLLDYFEGDAYKTYGALSDDQLLSTITSNTGSDANYWALWCAAIKFIWAEMNSNQFSEFFNKSTVTEYAAYTAAVYEVCNGCQVGGTAYNKRIQDAEAVYTRYNSGEFDAVENGTAESGGSEAIPTATTTEEEEGSNDDAGGETLPATNSPCPRSIPGNIQTPEEAVHLVNQFIIDTNKMYDRNYPTISSLQIDAGTGTPGSDEDVNYNPTVRNDWISRGLMASSDAGIYGCWGASNCGQCTTISGWFVTMMTGYTYNGGNGIEVVGNMLQVNPDLSATNTPTAYSVFSEAGDSAYGHTGIVIGDLGDGDFLTMERWNGHVVTIRKRTLSDFQSNGATFINLNGKLKLDHVGTTYD